jgi:hypothetical protein
MGKMAEIMYLKTRFQKGAGPFGDYISMVDFYGGQVQDQRSYDGSLVQTSNRDGGFEGQRCRTRDSIKVPRSRKRFTR